MKSVAAAALYLISALHPLLLLLRSDKQPQAHQPYLLLVGASTARWTEAYNWFHCFFCTPWLWWPAAAPAINGTTMDQEVKESFLFHYLTFLMKTGQFNNLKVEYLKQLKKVGKVQKYKSIFLGIGKNDWSKKEQWKTCGGKSQSPIDIKSDSNLPQKEFKPFIFHGYDSTFEKTKLENNGHSVKMSITKLYKAQTQPGVSQYSLNYVCYINISL